MSPKNWKGYIVGAVAGAMLAVGLSAWGAGLSYLSGPQPASDIASILNNFIQTLNANFQINQTTSAANRVAVLPSISGAGFVGISAAGADANLDLVLAGKASGYLKMSITSIVPTGTKGVSWSTNLAPSNANTSVQEWLVFKNSAGVSRFIPLF